MIEPTDRERRYLRRYVAGSKCTGPGSYHNAMEFLEVGPAENYVGSSTVRPTDQQQGNWPTHCACGYEFQETDARQIFTDLIYRRPDTGEEMTLRDAPPGAMWNATWFQGTPMWTGADGLALIVRCPDGRDWHIDGPASNCTMKGDHVHKCWVRHGVPPVLTVDKNGNTCQAGAGSIQTGTWHGFLRNGVLVQA